MNKMTINIAVLGFGYWGPNLVRNFARFDDCKIKYIIDRDINRLKAAQNLYPNIKCEAAPENAITDKNIDAVVVALPVSEHYRYAKTALENGKHVLLEKPCADSEEKLNDLIKTAAQKKVLLMADYTFLYTGAVCKLKEIVDKEIIGDVLYFDSHRMNIGTFRNDVNVIWDLAVHDISIMRFLMKDKPVSVIAAGISHTNNKVENIAYLSFLFNTNKIAHISCSWVFPFKVKRLFLGGSKKTVIYDDIEPTEKIKVYDNGFNIYDGVNNREKVLTDYRMGDIFVPKIDTEEALYNMCADFLSAVKNNVKPKSDIKFMREVTSILSACSQSLEQIGKQIKIHL